MYRLLAQSPNKTILVLPNSPTGTGIPLVLSDTTRKIMTPADRQLLRDMEKRYGLSPSKKTTKPASTPPATTGTPPAGTPPTDAAAMQPGMQPTAPAMTAPKTGMKPGAKPAKPVKPAPRPR